jgi:hypothetical protein
MNLHCQSRATSQPKQRTAPGYRRFSCRRCRRRSNERTGTPFNDLQFRLTSSCVRPARRHPLRQLVASPLRRAAELHLPGHWGGLATCPRTSLSSKVSTYQSY